MNKSQAGRIINSFIGRDFYSANLAVAITDELFDIQATVPGEPPPTERKVSSIIADIAGLRLTLTKIEKELEEFAD